MCEFFHMLRMKVYYFTSDMADMIFCYGLVNGSSLQAHVIYMEKGPCRRVPSDKMFSWLFQRHKGTDSLTPNKVNRGRPLLVHTSDGGACATFTGQKTWNKCVGIDSSRRRDTSSCLSGTTWTFLYPCHL